MKIKNVTLDQDLYQRACVMLLTLAAQIEGKNPDKVFPKLDSLSIALLSILSGFKNTGKYSAEDLAQELREIADTLNQVEGPKRGPL